MKYTTLLSLVALSTLSACKTTPNEYGLGDPIKPLTEQEQVMISARNAAIEAQYAHIEKGSLSNAEKIYRNAPTARNALKYTSLLRQVNLLTEAQMILKPFAINPKTATSDILNEYTKIKLAQGEFDQAQIFAQESMALDDTSPTAQMLLGVSIDAQGHHQAAENHFRQALEKASLNPDLQSSIKNNLALSLIAQGKTSEANSLLQGLKSALPLNSTTMNANKKLGDRL